MADIADAKMISRRSFIKGVIASGAAVSSASYLYLQEHDPERWVS
jgi:hypothetical protein